MTQDVGGAGISSAGSTKSGAKRRLSPGATTARQQKRRSAATSEKQRIKQGSRVKVTWKKLFPILQEAKQKDILRDYNDNYNFYGTVVSGNASKGYNISFDQFPLDSKVAFLKRNRIKVLKEGDEEAAYDREQDNPEALHQIEKTKKKTPFKESEDQFRALPDEDLATITKYELMIQPRHQSDGRSSMMEFMFLNLKIQ